MNFKQSSPTSANGRCPPSDTIAFQPSSSLPGHCAGSKEGWGWRGCACVCVCVTACEGVGVYMCVSVHIWLCVCVFLSFVKMRDCAPEGPCLAESPAQSPAAKKLELPPISSNSPTQSTYTRAVQSFLALECVYVCQGWVRFAQIDSLSHVKMYLIIIILLHILSEIWLGRLHRCQR